MARLDLAALEQLVRSLTAADATKTFDQVVDEACANQKSTRRTAASRSHSLASEIHIVLRE